MKAKILRAQGSYDVGQVVGKTQKTVLKKFYKDAFYTELLPLPFFLLASSPTQSFYIRCFVILGLILKCHSYLQVTLF